LPHAPDVSLQNAPGPHISLPQTTMVEPVDVAIDDVDEIDAVDVEEELAPPLPTTVRAQPVTRTNDKKQRFAGRGSFIATSLQHGSSLQTFGLALPVNCRCRASAKECPCCSSRAVLDAE
jgi:hypothetical protein